MEKEIKDMTQKYYIEIYHKPDRWLNKKAYKTYVKELKNKTFKVTYTKSMKDKMLFDSYSLAWIIGDIVKNDLYYNDVIVEVKSLFE